MITAVVATPSLSAGASASELRAMASAASFLEVLEEEMLREAVPTSLPPPTFPLPLPGPLAPEYPWVPLPLLVLPAPRPSSKEGDRTAKKRPPARRDRKSGRQ
ncbi:MAG: hypothetical protein JO128_13130 [Alphaproteobacteria bacterium]|nr:hypothetical protein [Alphaproteobacteria bacterium]